MLFCIFSIISFAFCVIYNLLIIYKTFYFILELFMRRRCTESLYEEFPEEKQKKLSGELIMKS